MLIKTKAFFMIRNTMPAISAIIPFYNTPFDLLYKSVKSILNQDFKDYEVLLIDDGSSNIDQTKLHELVASDKRVLYFRKTNGGAASARNFGLNMAKGEYITFVDSDDEIVPFFFSQSYGFARSNDADMVCGVTKPYRNKLPSVIRQTEPKVIHFGDNKISDLRSAFCGNIRRIENGIDPAFWGRVIGANLIKRDLLNEIRFDEKVEFGEDMLFYETLLHYKNVNCFVIEQIWYLYRLGDGSVTRSYKKDAIEKSEYTINRLHALLNLDNDIEYVAYINFILETIVDCIATYLYHKDSIFKLKDRIRIYHYLNHNSPWNDIDNKRYYKLSKGKHKIAAYTYKFRVLFPLSYVRYILFRR